MSEAPPSGRAPESDDVEDLVGEEAKLGIRKPLKPRGAAKIAANGRRWWKNSGMTINVAFPVSYFDGLGLPRLAATSTR